MAKPPGEPKAANAPRSGRILIVQSSPADALELMQSVVGLGHSVFGPLSGVEAVLHAVTRGSWDAALIGGEVGHDALKAITGALACEAIPFVIVQGAENVHHSAEGMLSLQKPWDRQLLEKIIIALLQGVGCTPPRMKLHFFERRLLARQIFSAWLAAEAPDFSVEAFSEPEDLSDADVAVVNVSSQDPQDPWVAKVMRELRTSAPAVPIAILCDSEKEAHVRWAFNAGARGYLPMSYDRKVIVQALRLIRMGGVFVPATVLCGGGETPSPTEDFRVLSPRQREVLSLLRSGKPNKIIAFELGLTEATVKMHVRNVMRKLGVKNRTQAAFSDVSGLESGGSIEAALVSGAASLNVVLAEDS